MAILGYKAGYPGESALGPEPGLPKSQRRLRLAEPAGEGRGLAAAGRNIPGLGIEYLLRAGLQIPHLIYGYSVLVLRVPL